MYLLFTVAQKPRTCVAPNFARDVLFVEMFLKSSNKKLGLVLYHLFGVLRFPTGLLMIGKKQRKARITAVFIVKTLLFFKIVVRKTCFE